jgi:hypothetical protein
MEIEKYTTIGGRAKLRDALIGAILNKTDMDHIGRCDDNCSDLYRKKHYGRYNCLDT